MQQSPSEGKQKRHVAHVAMIRDSRDTSKLVVGKSERQENKTKVPSRFKSLCSMWGIGKYPFTEFYRMLWRVAVRDWTVERMLMYVGVILKTRLKCSQCPMKTENCSKKNTLSSLCKCCE